MPRFRVTHPAISVIVEVSDEELTPVNSDQPLLSPEDRCNQVRGIISIDHDEILDALDPGKFFIEEVEDGTS